MATVNAQGITPTSLAQYIADLGAAFQSALGSDLDLATETPQGQLIANLSLIMAQADEGVVAVGNGYSVARAQGIAQDDLVGLLGVERREATRSMVTATIAGVAGTGIPQYAQARTTAGDVFRATTAATISTGGSVDVDFEAVETGPVPAAAGALTEIVTNIVGWETITNAAAAASLGRDVETATVLWGRYSRHVGRNARTSTQALEAQLLETAGVTDALVRENATGMSETEQGQVIPTRAIFSAVDGGANAAVGRTIADYKPGGSPTAGASSVTVDVLNADGQQVSTIVINFRRVADLPITLAAPITVGSGFPADGLERISDGLVAYIADYHIGDPLDSTRLLAPILAVPGHQLGTLTIARKTDGIPAWATATAYTHPIRVLGSNGAVYDSVQNSTGQDPTTDASDTYWTLAGAVTDRDNVRLWERITMAADDITITVL